MPVEKAPTKMPSPSDGCPVGNNGAALETLLSTIASFVPTIEIPPAGHGPSTKLLATRPPEPTRRMRETSLSATPVVTVRLRTIRATPPLTSIAELKAPAALVSATIKADDPAERMPQLRPNT